MVILTCTVLFFADGLNEVRALCHLSVRLVTEAMLFNSITVRLDQLTQSQFISSPLYTRFLSALASIIPAAEQDVFLFNVQDDTDADEDQTIVNVSFSVRKRMELNEDVFYSQQFLRERVYLQRTLLARLSTLEVGRLFMHIDVHSIDLLVMWLFSRELICSKITIRMAIILIIILWFNHQYLNQCVQSKVIYRDIMMIIFFI